MPYLTGKTLDISALSMTLTGANVNIPAPNTIDGGSLTQFGCSIGLGGFAGGSLGVTIETLSISVSAAGGDAASGTGYFAPGVTSGPIIGSLIASGATLYEVMDTEGKTGGSPYYNDVLDSPPYTKLHLYWVLLKGTTFTVTGTISMNGGTATATTTGTITGDTVYSPSAIATISAQYSNDSETDTDGDGVSDSRPIGSIELTATFSGIPESSPGGGTVTVPGPYSVDGYAGSSVTGAANSGSLKLIGRGGDFAYAVVSASAAYPAHVDIGVDIREAASGGAYGGALNISISPGDGTTTMSGNGGSVSATLHNYSFSGELSTPASGAFTLPTYSRYDPFIASASLSASSLVANGEDYQYPPTGAGLPRITRLPLRDTPVNGISISHAATWALPFPLSKWTGTGGATVTTSGSQITITAGSGGSGGAELVFDPVQSFLSYRWLRYRRTGAAHTLTIPAITTDIDAREFPGVSGGAANLEDVYTGGETSSKSWHIGAGSETAETAEIDLCCPVGSGTGGAEDFGTRWPYPTRMGANQGVWRADKLVISGIPAGESVTIDALEFFIQHGTSMDVLDEFHRDKIVTPSEGFPSLEGEWPHETQPIKTLGGGAGSVVHSYEKRGLLTYVDGKQAVEEPFLWYERYELTSGDTSYVWHDESILSLCARINAIDGYNNPTGYAGVIRYPGVIATPGITDPGAYTGDSIPPANPYFYVGAYAAWLSSPAGVVDLGMGATSAPLWDVVQLSPGSSVSYTAFAVLGAGAQGLVIDDTPAPVAGKTVTLTQTQTDPAIGGTNRGSGDSDADGWYHTGAPSGHAGNVFHKAAIGSAAGVSFSASDWFARKRHRASLISELARVFGILATDGPRQWLHVASGKRIGTYHIATNDLVFQSADHPVSGWLSLCYDPRRATLFCVGQIGTRTDHAAKVYTSTNGGRTIAEVLAVTGKSFKIERDSERQIIVLLYQDAADKVQRKATGDGGATWSDPVQVTSGGTGLSGVVIDLEQDPRANGAFFFTLGTDLDSDGNATSAKVYRSTDIGRTWSVMLS